jgi:hypothetical protein
MYLLLNAQFYNKPTSNLDGGVEGIVLLNNDFQYSFTLFDKYSAWRKIEELEDQYSIEQLESLEKELFSILGKARIPKFQSKSVKAILH